MNRTGTVAIVGAGPAGARAAEFLATLGADVVLLDSKAPWEKPCGGGLTPPTFDDIPEFYELESSARAIDRVRVEIGAEEGFSVDLRRPIRIVSRRTLGRWQLDRALAAGAVHLRVRVRSVVRSGGGWQLDTDGGPLRAAVLIGADGAASLVRRVASPGLPVELAPARVAYPRCRGPEPEMALLKFYDGVAGYLWDFPRRDHHSVGIVVAGANPRRRELDREVEAYWASSDGSSSAGLVRAGAVIGTAQLGHGDFQGIAGGDFALVGDAAGFADPLTGEGIHNALRSAALLARAWRAGDLLLYPSLARNEFAAEFALARFLRRSMLESGSGFRLVRSALTSNAAYATVAGLVNALVEHDASVVEFARRWSGALRCVRRDAAA